MNNIWTSILFVIICVLAGYYLSQFWAPFGWIGFLGAFVLIGVYIYQRNRRIQ